MRERQHAGLVNLVETLSAYDQRYDGPDVEQPLGEMQRMAGKQRQNTVSAAALVQDRDS